MKEVIMKVPSFSADYPKAPIYVADLVRCKECIYYSDGECKCGLLPFSEYSDTANLWVTPKPDDFCSYGEREDE